MTEVHGAEHDVVALYQGLLDRWNTRDAAGMARLVISDGYLIGFDGSQHDGPAQTEAALRQIFEHHQTARYVARVKSVRFLTNEVAVLLAVAGMAPPGQADINPEVNAVQTLVAVRKEGGWRVAVFQNTPAAFHGRPELAEQLTEELRQVLREQKTEKHKEASGASD